MLFRGWLASFERNLGVFYPIRQPSCLVALEELSPIGYIIVEPFNRRGTCWSLSTPEILHEPKSSGEINIRKLLIKRALDFVNSNTNAHSWIMRCPTNDVDQRAIARELGFQPLKIFNQWRKEIKGDIQSICPYKPTWPVNLEWQKLNRKNADILWPLLNSNYSVHLRQILDLHWTDLLNNNPAFSGVLISKGAQRKSAIAGIINRTNQGDYKILEIIRDVAWDQRLRDTLPTIINELSNTSGKISIEISREDEHLASILRENNLVEQGEIILFGKSTWRKQFNNKLISDRRPLESMLGGLQPQNPPLPSPSIGRNLLK